MLFDEDTVRAMLALTASTVKSEEDATAVFSKISRGRPRTLDGGMDSPGYFDTSDWELGQQWARRWLPKVAEFGRLSPSTRSALLAEINGKLLGFADGMQLRLGSRGLMLVPLNDTDTIANACLRAFIPFLIPNGWTPRRLGQCQYEECGQWFMRPEPKRGSVPLYCSPKHANLARVRAFREKQKQEISANEERH